MKLSGVLAPGNNTMLASVGLLILRIWIGGSMLLLHGLDKATNFTEMSKAFADPLHIGSKASLALAVLAEVLCSILLVSGLVTRVAALILAINMGVAFAIVHGMRLTGDMNGEMAFVYLASYVALMLAGPGAFSADAVMFSSKK